VNRWHASISRNGTADRDARELASSLMGDTAGELSLALSRQGRYGLIHESISKTCETWR
jgi:hypothetical protein